MSEMSASFHPDAETRVRAQTKGTAQYISIKGPGVNGPALHIFGGLTLEERLNFVGQLMAAAQDWYQELVDQKTAQAVESIRAAANGAEA